ncbi:hypothetical protein NDU88_004560 [Pleurodeles waltl]|uniref:Uncharacterized protein n=1 Tax=Pleurodeles waltl TaxID=8319 RepID=A0AAV7NU32_PLEWA|nr:hypothetical protein NDU88_004560 [Pleurodeles waltl]
MVAEDQVALEVRQGQFQLNADLAMTAREIWQEVPRARYQSAMLVWLRLLGSTKRKTQSKFATFEVAMSRRRIVFTWLHQRLRVLARWKRDIIKRSLAKEIRMRDVRTGNRLPGRVG